VAALQAGPLANADAAIDTYQEILDFDATERSALGALEHLLTEQERWMDLQDILIRRLDCAEDDNERIVIYLKQAEMARKRFESIEDGVEAYQSVLAIDPRHQEANSGIEQLLALAERWSDLVDQLDRRADIAATEGDSDEELRLLVRIGDIWEQNLHDQQAAIEIYERVLARDPNHTRALGALARLHEAAGDWDRCASVLEKAASSGGSDKDVAEMWFRLGRLNQEHLNDEAKAEEYYWKSIELDPILDDAITALRGLLEAHRQMDKVADLLERKLRNTTGPEGKVELLRDLGQIYLKKLNHADLAVPFLEQARELEPHNKDVLLMLVDVYLGAGRQAEAVPVLKGLIEAETAALKGGRSKELAVFHHRLGQALQAADDKEAAMVQYQAAYKMDLGNVEVLSSLGLLCYEDGDFDQAMKVFRGLLLQRTQSEILSKSDIYYKMGDIYMQQDDKRRALSMFQRGLEADKGHEDCVRMVEELKGSK
jgi:tetratricopeptide (TPR) repeat protein